MACSTIYTKLGTHTICETQQQKQQQHHKQQQQDNISCVFAQCKKVNKRRHRTNIQIQQHTHTGTRTCKQTAQQPESMLYKCVTHTPAHSQTAARRRNRQLSACVATHGGGSKRGQRVSLFCYASLSFSRSLFRFLSICFAPALLLLLAFVDISRHARAKECNEKCFCFLHSQLLQHLVQFVKGMRRIWLPQQCDSLSCGASLSV